MGQATRILGMPISLAMETPVEVFLNLSDSAVSRFDGAVCELSFTFSGSPHSCKMEFIRLTDTSSFAAKIVGSLK